ncbi:hypothetical protein C8F04DRAFT_1085120 [Mycena alexandri]|uniref:Uncharacterized protein n=1 Tax=Mycena alexandri TaxID=1745969 RepID=A0AAD6X914_9AGAR|nr:hypothetical protein C8F04DRAFT_1085120 [Mycena alexandri]
MKTSDLDGKRLIELPGKTVELVPLKFSREEREMYNQESPLRLGLWIHPTLKT